MKNIVISWLIVGLVPMIAQSNQFGSYGSINFDQGQGITAEDLGFGKFKTGSVLPPPAQPPKPVPAVDLEWVSIEGTGEEYSFNMGTDDDGYGDELPIIPRKIKSFKMTKGDITVGQYRKCVAAGKCEAPKTCDYGSPTWTDKPSYRENYPVNCVTTKQAEDYASFMNARLPTEAEFEYAATNRGESVRYPWGKDAPGCDKVVKGGCGFSEPQSELAQDGKSCARTLGQTKQGLCDMSGNVWKWTQDVYHNSYKDSSAEGLAYSGAGSDRVVRGGSFGSRDARYLRADLRGGGDPGYRSGRVGFRLVRERRD